ncbi:MAG: YCF48-related protein [Lentimicrobium sp.]
MKKFVFVFLFSAISLLSFSQWYWVNPKPTGNHLSDVFFVNSSVGYVVGGKGTIMKTQDGGETWNVIPPVMYRNFRFVWFCSTDTGYVTSDSGTLFKTTNGGYSWSQLQTGTTDEINDICFIDEQTGFIATDNGKLLKTSNGGVTWQIKISANWEITSVSFANESRGIATSRAGKYYLTNDGGNSWTGRTSPMETHLWNATYSDDNHCFVVGQGGDFMRSSDGGSSWEYFNCGALVDRMCFRDNLTGYALSSSEYLFIGSRLLYKTINGGSSWVPLGLDNLSAVCLKGNDTIVAVGTAGRLLTTADDGATYTNYNASVSYDDFSDIHFPGADTGYATGFFGDIVKTVDAGENWELLPHGPYQYLNSVNFTDNNKGFVTADSSVYMTTDGGLNWNRIFSSPRCMHMTDIFFVDHNTGFVIGEANGVIYRTDDGGITWNLIYEFSYESPSSIYFLDKDTGFVAFYSSVMKTTDGGQNWSITEIDNECIFLDMFFVNSQTGFVTGSCNNLRIYKTSDGGLTWTPYNFPGYNTGKSIYFIDEDKGFLGASGDGFFQTSDGGETWISIEYIPGYTNAIWFTDINTGIIAGNHGKIMKTTNSGTVSVISAEKPASSYTLSPNPADSDLLIHCNSNNTQTTYFALYTMNGKCLLTDSFTGQTVKLSLSEYPSGIYFVRIGTNKGVEVRKVVKI